MTISTSSDIDTTPATVPIEVARLPARRASASAPAVMRPTPRPTRAVACRAASQLDRDYPPGLCPNAERLIQETLAVLPWNEAYTKTDVDDIAQALRKVHAGV